MPSAAAAFHRDRTPLPESVGQTGTGQSAAIASSGTGGAALHMLLGLAVVVALIFVLYWLMKRARRNDGAVARRRLHERRRRRRRSAPTARRCTSSASATSSCSSAVERAASRRSASTPPTRRASSAVDAARPRARPRPPAAGGIGPRSSRRSEDDRPVIVSATPDDDLALEPGADHAPARGCSRSLPGHAARDDGLHADPDRARVRPERARDAAEPAEPGPRRDRALPLPVRDGADAAKVDNVAVKPYRAHKIDAQRGDRCAASSRCARSCSSRRATPTSRSSSSSRTRSGRRRAPTCRPTCSCPRSSSRELKTAFEIGFLIYLPFLIIDMIVAATLMSMGMMMLPPVLDLAAVQDPAVRARRRLAPRRAIARAVLPLTRRTRGPGHRHPSRDAGDDASTLKVSAPFLLAGLAVGLVVSIFQAATSIQEQTLSFIPKIVVTGVVIAIGGPWMLDQMVAYTQSSSRASRPSSAQ